ncbi:MAG: aminopeptidase N [Thermodesulfobacteriota bacterium]
MNETTPKAILRQDYLPPAWLIETVELAVDLYEERAVVRARLACRRNPAAGAPGGPLVLDGQGLRLLGIALDGAPLATARYRLESDRLTVLDPPERLVLETEAEIHPAENTSLEGLYRSGGMFCTQCEAEGFRKITWFCDRPDVLARYTVTISADRAKYPVLLANGNLVKSSELGDGRHAATWQDPFPKPSYLFAMVAGDLTRIADRFTTRSGRPVSLEIYVEHHNRDKCDHAMASLKRAMAWDEEAFGLEYDLDQYMIVAVDDFNMGAMENKGLNIFNSRCVLARPDTATDAEFESIEAVVAHEYFHNWTGNRVTCRDWFQLSLKEGLTVFRDQQFTADMTSAAVQRIHNVRFLRNAQFLEDNGPMAHPVRPDSYIEINNFYTLTVYEKGAELIRMLHTLLGPEQFRAGIVLYLSRHDGAAATCNDFVDAMVEVSGRDLGQFRRWYSQAGTPVLTVQTGYDPEGRRYQLQLSQHTPPTPGQPEKLPLHLPIRLALLASDGSELPLNCPGREAEAGRSLFELKEARETMVCEGVAELPALSILRDFSAPVKVVREVSDQELLFLFAHDPNPFSRWEAGQQLAVRLLLGLAADFRQGRALALGEEFVGAWQQLLEEGRGWEDKPFLALLLTLPSEEYLGEQMETIDVEAIHAARRFARRQLALALRPLWEEIYHANRPTGPYRYTPAEAGRRELKNLALASLAAIEDDAAAALCLAQFREADNMTDQQAAFTALVHSARPERRQAVEEFYARWQADTLVLDKWFSVQATAPQPETLGRVKELLGHPAFRIKNPNKVHSLIGSFAGANPLCFHAADGAGYAFLAEQIMALDPINPHVAARLARRLGRWKRYDPARQELMRAALSRILGRGALSRDLYEVASKGLAG